MNCNRDGCPFYREVYIQDEAGDVDPHHTCGLDIEIGCMFSQPQTPETCPLQQGKSVSVSALEDESIAWEEIDG